MRISIKSIFYGLAGLAVTSGAGYYLYKKRLSFIKDPAQQLQYLRKIIFEQKSVSFNNIMNVFNTTYNLSIGKYVNELSKDNIDYKEIKTRLCKKNLKGQYFYECLDCSVSIKNNKHGNEEKENLNQYTHQICEDCFDHNIHKGHKYKLIQCIAEGSCDCGLSFLVEEKSFCSNHSGFRDLRKEFKDSFPNEIKIETINYFKELFYILIDGETDLIYNSMRNENKALDEIASDSDKFVQFNTLFIMILEQIKQTIDSHHPFVFCFTQLMQQSFSKPTRIDSSIETFLFLEEKAIDNQETIFGYLLKYQAYMNEISINNFNTLLEVLSSADQLFVEFISKQHIRLIAFAIQIQVIEDQQGVYQSYSMPKISEICKNGFGSQQFTHNLHIQNEEFIINTIKIFHKIIQNMSFSLESDFFVISNIFSYIYGLFEYPETIEKYQRIEEVLELLIDTQQIIFEKIQIVQSPQIDIFENLASKIGIIIGYLGLLSFIQDIFYKIAVYSQKNLSKERKALILRILSKKFYSSIQNNYKSMKLHKDVEKQDKNYLGLSLCPLIISIIIISEGTNLSQEDIMNALKKNFPFENDQEISEFINIMVEILHCNLISYCFHKNGYLLIPFTLRIQQIPEYGDLINQLWHQISFSEYLIYDSHMLTFQLLTSVQENSQHLFSQVLNNFDPTNFIGEINNHIKVAKPIILLKQIYFDQTPFMNINKKLKNILNQDNQQFQDSVQYATKQVINNLLKWQPNKSKIYQQFMELIQYSILDIKLIEQILPLFGEIKESQDLIDLKPLQEMQSSSLNLGRYLNNVIDNEIKSERSMTRYYESVEGTLSNLFVFQQKSIIKSFADTQLFTNFIDKLRNTPINSSLILFQNSNSILVVWAELISLLENNTLALTEEEIKSINLLKEEINSSESFEVINSMIQTIEKLPSYEKETFKLEGVKLMKQIYLKTGQIKLQK